jgi:competence protein ComEC
MPFYILCFAGGIWLLQQQPALPPLAGAAALGAILPVVYWGRNREGVGRWLGRLALALLCFGAGYYWAAGIAHERLADRLPVEWEGRDIAIVGVVSSLPLIDERAVRFQFEVEHVLTDGAEVPKNLSIAWWRTAPRDPDVAAFPELQPGQRWALTVRLRRPRGTANPNGFDYEAWLLERGIRATGYVRTQAPYRLLSPMTHAPRYWAEAVRHSLRGRIQAALGDRPYAGVIAALAVGDQRAIPPEQWQTFTRTGINHLMSISGLHVTMVSGLVFFLANALWRRSARLTAQVAAPRAAALFGLLAAFVYTVLAGFAVPAQRTLYMLAVAALALWLGATGSISAILASALLAVLLLDPWAVLAPGFWLSFGAVAVILYATVGRIARAGTLRNWTTVQCAVTVALVPPLLAMFQQVSLVSPIANAVAIPVVSLVVVPLTLVGTVVPFDLPLHAAHVVMRACMAVLEWFAERPHAVWQQHAPASWTVVVAIAGVAWLFLPRGFPARWLGLILGLPLFLIAPPPLAHDEARVTVLDVGQGLSVIVQTRDHALLYDTGPAFGPGADSGSRIVVPFLRAAGVHALDAMVVSHDDIDHTGGVDSVLGAVPVARVYTSLPDLDPLPVQSANALRCFSGQAWSWDGVQFQMLGPSRESYDDPTLKDNDRSCVLKIVTRAGHFLLPADIERRGERALIARYGGELYADVLLAPHQGSRTSSSSDFVAEVSPQVVVFPVGYRNRFGHPHREVVERYRALGVRMYRTDRDGAVSFFFTREGEMRVEPYRAAYQRYWQTPFAGEPPANAETF